MYIFFNTFLKIKSSAFNLYKLACRDLTIHVTVIILNLYPI